MLTFTDRARDVVHGYLDDAPEALQALRITLHEGSPLAPRYELTLVSVGDRTDEEVEIDAGDFPVIVRESAVPRLQGATVDFVEQDAQAGFQIRDLQPTAEPEHADGSIAQRVQKLLDEQVNPGIATHGGAISLARVEGTEVYIEMSGGCQGCAMSRMTLRQGVERMLRQSVPEITALHDVTDHAGGESPYFDRPV